MNTLREFINKKLEEKNALKPKGEKKVKIADIARALEVTPQSLNTVLNRNSPNLKTVNKIAEFLEIDPGVIANYASMESNATLTKESAAKYVSVPYVSIQARASIIEQGGYSQPEIEDTYHVLQEPGQDYGNSYVFEVNGDSMEPTITSGSKILCETIDQSNWQYINSGLYVIQFADYLLLKRVKSNDMLTKGYLELHSDNSQGGSVVVKQEDIRRIWRYKATVFAIAK